jgi:Ca2+-binding RTX toxin-like protein
MAIFRTGKLNLARQAFGVLDIEDNQSSDDAGGTKILKASGKSLEADATDIMVRVEGTFVIQTGVIGSSLNEAIDTKIISGQVEKVVLGFYVGAVFNSVIEVSDIKKSLADLSDDFNTDGFFGLLSGNDEIYGSNDQLLNDLGNPSTDKDGAGNIYNGNLLHGYNGNDKIYGGKFIDSLWGDKGNDTLWGYGGNDFLNGGVGSDILNGGDGNDKLNGGTGADMLYGALGNDILVGNSGSDKFVFDAALNGSTNLDTIKDFVRGTDKIVLDDDIFTRFASKSSIASGNLITGTKALQLDDHLIYNTSNDTLYYDADGSGAKFGLIAFVKIELVGSAAPSATDFQVIA